MSFGWRNKRLLFDRKEEKRQFVVSGDQGTGKSQLVMQILDYVERCGDVAVVLDAKLEFASKYFNVRRGDPILSPKDNRCPSIRKPDRKPEPLWAHSRKPARR